MLSHCRSPDGVLEISGIRFRGLAANGLLIPAEHPACKFDDRQSVGDRQVRKSLTEQQEAAGPEPRARACAAGLRNPLAHFRRSARRAIDFHSNAMEQQRAPAATGGKEAPNRRPSPPHLQALKLLSARSLSSGSALRTWIPCSPTLALDPLCRHPCQMCCSMSMRAVLIASGLSVRTCMHASQSMAQPQRHQPQESASKQRESHSHAYAQQSTTWAVRSGKLALRRLLFVVCMRAAP